MYWDPNNSDRHRKPAVDDNGKSASPRKAIATDGSFGTMF